MPLLFALTMFVSATLLFLVQPMVGKMVLPLLGGTPAVWNSCMVFYQSLLLLGYFYAHKSTTDLDTKTQTRLHAFVLLGAFAVMFVAALVGSQNSPIPVAKSLSPQGDDYPFFGVIVLLTVAIGMPFFVVSTSAPLLQKWFAQTGHPSARDPYFLYAASNFGSLLALIAYPAVVEPNLRIIHQAWLWAIGYALLVALVIACARAVNRSTIGAAPKMNRPVADLSASHDPPPSLGRKLRWLALAFVPSSLMLGVTTFMSTDMVSIPLLWIIPLSLYLITFIIVFAKVPPALHLVITLLMPVMVLLVAFVMTSRVQVKFQYQMMLHIATFFVVTMACHGELARDRPSTKYLTSFYLLMSVGGMLGGLFNALVAPIIFTFTSEYPITLVAACFLLPAIFDDKDASRSDWTPVLDVLLPLGVFFLCRQAQANQVDIVNYTYLNGKYLLAATVLFALPGVFACFLLKNWRAQVALAVLLGLSLLSFGFVAFFVDSVNGLAPAGLTGLTAIRLLPSMALAALYARHCRRSGDPEGRREMMIGLGALAAGFAFMLLLAGTVSDQIMTDVAFRADISGETVRHILIYGVPAMICYFFVERPRRFGLAVAALWFATFFTERGGINGLINGREDLVYDRSFFGRLRIDTDDRWKSISAELFPSSMQDDTDHYDIETYLVHGDSYTYFTPKGQAQSEYKIVTYQTEYGPQRFYYKHRAFTTLLHGTTTHGLQERDRMRFDITRALWFLSSANPLEVAGVLEAGAGEAMQFPGRDPTSYYHRTGPVGAMFDVFTWLNRTRNRSNTSVACIGLGTGSLSAYGQIGQPMTFFEIDTHVRKLVEPGKHFRYLDDAKRQGVPIDFVMGDARVSLERLDRKFGFMLVDAFSSDAIPAHLLTKQAFELFFQRLEDDGLLAVHISNRYLDLEPVVERICRELHLEARVMHGSGDPEDAKDENKVVDQNDRVYSTFKYAATWIVVARTKAALGPIDEWSAETVKEIDQQVAELEQKNHTHYDAEDRQIVAQRYFSDRWVPLSRKDSVGLWTDDYSPIIPILRGEWRFWAKK